MLRAAMNLFSCLSPDIALLASKRAPTPARRAVDKAATAAAADRGHYRIRG